MPCTRNALNGFRRVALALWLVCVGAACAQIANADSVTLLAADNEAARARFELIDSARHEIDLAYFIIENDRFSKALVRSIHAAARRGVRVRMVVDGFCNGIPLQTRVALLRAGVQLREYHRPRFLRPQLAIRRLHDKYLCADRSNMIVGGRNISNAYFGLKPGVHTNYLDLDIQVQGESVHAAFRYFNELWASPELHHVTSMNVMLNTAPQFLNSCYRDVRERLDNSGRPMATQERHRGRFETLQIPPYVVEFLYDPDGKKDESVGVHARLYQLFESARREIVIETPYFVPDDRLSQILEAALKRKVRVIILTNSLETTDRAIVYPAYRDLIKKQLKLGAEIWEYKGAYMLHGKAVVVDGLAAGITSFNCDPRSAYLDTQTGVLIHDRRLAVQVLQAMQTHFVNATPLHDPRRPMGIPSQMLPEQPATPSAPTFGVPNPMEIPRQARRILSHALVRHL